MYCDRAWGGDPKIQTLEALLNTTIYSYSETFRGWTSLLAEVRERPRAGGADGSRELLRPPDGAGE